jgi:penicillin-binding protein
MKKRNWLLLALCLTAGVSAGAVVYAVSADSEEEAVQNFLNAWQNRQYAQMYQQVSTDVKQTMTEEQFVKRYESVYAGVEAQHLDVHAVSSDQEEAFRFHVKMDTLAGTVEFDHDARLVQEGRRWTVAWDPSYLFPDLKAEEKISAEVLKAPRGPIVDRKGNGLAINEEQYAIGLVPKDLQDATLPAMAQMLKTDVTSIEAKLKATWVRPDTFVPVAVLPKTDMRVRPLLNLPGVTAQNQQVRAYPLAEAAAHLIGYVGDGDVGKAGLEQLLEERLHGKDGGRILIQTADGQNRALVAQRDPQPGDSVQVTLDASLQEKVYEQLQHEAGAGVAIHPLTGEVLALVSTPAYDPNEMAHGVSEAQWKSWNNDPNRPLQNRFANLYPPGSAFKPLTAALALDARAITPQATHEIAGKKWQADASWGGYSVTRVSDAFHSVDLEKALIASDNIYFAQAALSMGSTAFVEAANQFGFGESLPLLYPFEASTLFNQGMQSQIQLADSGYGQGEILMNPLHVAVAYTAFANGGNVMAPRLFSGEPEKVWKANVITPRSAQIVSDDMVQVIANPAGTGHDARIDGLKLAGKTGTAEVKAKQDTTGKEVGWFVAYDTDDPRLLIALMAEQVQGRGGSHLLAPIVRALFQTLPH